MTTRNWMSQMMFTIATATLAASTVPRDAVACGGEWYPAMMQEPQIDHRIHGVPRAEEALEEGRIVAAAGAVIRMMPHIKQLSPKSAKIVERAQRVLALTVVRHEGALPLGYETPKHVQGTWLGKTEDERRANLTWSVSVLREVSKLREEDPMSQTELAEALAALDETRAEARAILEKLAARDLVTSPEGYATLAELRRKDGDHEGQKLAMERCEKMAKDRSACSSRATG